MHVTLVSSISPNDSQPGGTRSYVLDLAQRLRDRGIGVCLVARDKTGLPIVAGSYIGLPGGPSNVPFLLRLATNASTFPIPADSILHFQRPDATAAMALARPGNPTVCTLHGIPATAVTRRRGGTYGMAYRLLEWIGLRRSDRIIAVDSCTARWYRTHYPSIADRITVVPIGIDMSRFRPLNKEASRRRFATRKDHVIVYAGRLSPEKRIGAIIESLAEVPGAELLVAGTGPEEERLRKLAQGRPVRFLGSVPREDMPDLLNAADVLVLASEFEGLPTAALEALSCGVPVVTTPVGALPEIVIPGKTGWIADDLDALGRTLAKAIDARDMRSACVEAARPYAWDVVLDRVVAVYDQLEAAA